MARFSRTGTLVGLLAAAVAGGMAAGPLAVKWAEFGPTVTGIAGQFWGASKAASAAPSARARPPVPVKTVRVIEKEYSDRVEALGTLRANESAALTAPVTDMVSAIYFEDGQRVEKGQVLLEIVTAEEKALKGEAAAHFNEAKNQYERTKELAARKVAPDTILDQRRAEMDTAEARLKAIEARLSDRIIRAPFAGVMGLRTISVGAMLDPGRSFARIEDDSAMKLDFSVPSTFLTTLKPGLSIVARSTSFTGKEFEGTVTSVDNSVDDVTRTIRVRALIPNAQRELKPGLLMSIDLLKNPRHALVVLEEAIVPAGGESFVFVVDEAASTVARRPVETGARRPGEVEIRSGLKAGELVVTDGGMKLGPGAPVKVLEAEPAKPAAGNETAPAVGNKS